MAYHTDNKVAKYVRGYGFMSYAKKFGSRYGKRSLNKETSASTRIKNSATKFNENNCDKTLKKEGLKVGKLAGKQLSDKIVLAATDLAGSKIADKITSLKMSDDQEPQEEIEEE